MQSYKSRLLNLYVVEHFRSFVDVNFFGRFQNKELLMSFISVMNYSCACSPIPMCDYPCLGRLAQIYLELSRVSLKISQI